MNAIPKELRKNLLRGYRERIAIQTGKSIYMVDKVLGGTAENLAIYEAILAEIERGKEKKKQLRLKTSELAS